MIASLLRALTVRRARHRLAQHVQANLAARNHPYRVAARKGVETRRRRAQQA